jgi:hypothetical protein
MNTTLLSLAALADSSAAPPASSSNTGAALIAAARLLLANLERARAIDAETLRNGMSTAFGGSDAAGAWNWKTPTTPARGADSVLAQVRASDAQARRIALGIPRHAEKTRGAPSFA